MNAVSHATNGELQSSLFNMCLVADWVQTFRNDTNHSINITLGGQYEARLHHKPWNYLTAQGGFLLTSCWRENVIMSVMKPTCMI